jgi:alkaline phosphatase D
VDDRAGAGGAFPHGVASGDPLADAVLIWTRVTTTRAEEPLEWVVARDPGLSDVVARGRAVARREHDHAVTIDVTGLAPGTTHWYRFAAAGGASPTGRTRTLPGPGADRARLAVCCCAKYSAGFFNAYARIAERDDLDLVLHLGDYLYEYPDQPEQGIGAAIGRAMTPAGPAVTLADYRGRYAECRRDPDLRALHAAHPVVATIDDHEVCENAWREGAKDHDPATQGPWRARRAAALRAWREWLPSRAVPGDPPTIHRRVALGDLADLFVLDGRSHRDEQVTGPRVDDPARTMLGPEQLAWLLDGLAGSRAAWRLIGNPVMMGQVATRFMPAELGEPLSELGILTARDHGPAPDQWDGYPAERDRVLGAIERRDVRDVVVLSGDVHTSWAVDLRRDGADPAAPPLAAEVVTPSVTSENLDEHLGVPERREDHDVEDEVDRANPHVRWVDLDRHGFTVVEVARDRVRADWWFVPTVRRRAPGAERGATWCVDRGRPGLRPGP